MGRTIAIGDIHGCQVALGTLLSRLAPTAEDKIVCLGDMVDRGPDSADVIRQMMDLGTRCQLIVVQGNHEELLLNAVSSEAEVCRWLRSGGRETLLSYGWSPARSESPSQWIPDEHLSFPGRSVPFHQTADTIFVHAGLVAELELTEQPELVLRWRITHRDSVEPHCSGKTVIVGHTPQRSGQVLDLGFLRCIDTNCVRGGWLTAMDVETGQIWQTNQRGELRMTGGSPHGTSRIQ